MCIESLGQRSQGCGGLALMSCIVWPRMVGMVICVPDRVALLAPRAQATGLQLQLSSQDTPTASSGPS